MAEQSSNNPYVDTFLTARPKDGIDAVQERLRNGRLLDEELAQYFRERAQIEDQYAKSLIKASKKLLSLIKLSWATLHLYGIYCTMNLPRLRQHMPY